MSISLVTRYALILLLTQGIAEALGQDADLRTGSSKSESITIAPEPLPLKVGAPLSNRTPVARPVPIKGLISWTIESRRHRGWLYSSAVSPDGRWVATGGLDGAIRIWDAHTGDFLRVFVGHDSYVYGLAWSSDGKYLVSGGAFDASARVWDAETGRLLRKFKHSAYVGRVAWSPDGRQLMVAGGESGHIIIWDVMTTKELAKIEMGKRVLSVSWAPNGRTIAIGAQGQPPQLVDVSGFKVRASAGTESDDVNGVAWSPDSRFLAAATSKATIVWDTTENKLARSMEPASCVAWSVDGKTIATALSGGLVQLFNGETGEKSKSITASANEISWSKDGSVLITQTPATISIWDVAKDKVRHKIDTGGSSLRIDWFQGGKMFFTGIGTLNVSVRDQNGKPMRDLTGHTGAVTCLAVTANGKVLATGSADKTIKIWEIASGKVLHTLEGHTEAITDVAWSTNGRNLASSSTDRTVRHWEASKGRLEHTLTGHTKATTTLAWSAKSLASGSADGQVILWNTSSGQKVRTLAVNVPLQSLAWTDDGRFLATGNSEDKLTVWNVATGTPVVQLQRPGSPPAVASIAWSPNGAFLAAGRGNHTVQLWDVRREKSVHDLQSMAPVHSVAWAASGKIILAGTSDRCVRSWDATSGQILATIIGEPSGLYIVSANGHYRAENESQSELIYVAQTDKGQITFSPADFAEKFHWKNSPQAAKLIGE